MTRNVRLRLKAHLSDTIEHKRWVRPSVGPTGEAVMLVVDQPDFPIVIGHEESPAGALFPRTRMQRPVTGMVLVHHGDRVRRVTLHDLDLAYPMGQPLPNGEILVVGARCRRFPDGTAEHNARVYGAGGALKREMVLGDGINEVQTTASGDIWVSYSDEGIFGNYGWGSGEDSTPIGTSGLARFDAWGAKHWEYEPPEGFDHMDDCYALNVGDEAAWAYYYTDFPLVRIDFDGQVRAWNTAIGGARAFAVDGRRVLLFGGYRPDRERCALGELGDTALEKLAECRLILPSGEPLQEGHVVGRGPILHVFAGTSWYQVDIRRL